MVLLVLLACSPGVSPADVDSAAGSGPALETGAEAGDTADSDTALPDTAPGETADTAPGDTAPEDTRSKALCAILRREDANADGSHESGDRSRVDASGNLLLKEYTDGSGVARTRVTYTYDATNALLVEEDDFDADGVVDVTFTRTYDPQGNELTLVTTGLWDADYSWSYVYDGAGRVLVAEYDGYFDHTDGIVDERDVFTRDAAGNPLLVTQDTDMDGAPELGVTRTWDADGRVLTEAWDYELLDAWGTPYADEGWAYIYDADGNTIVVEYDAGLDGESVDVWTYSYDADGHVLVLTTDRAGDGLIEGVDTYTYDADGNELTHESVSESGSVMRRYTWVDGRMTRLEVDRDGALLWWQEYTYDAAGDLSEMVEYLASGTADYRETYTYECDG